MERLIINPLTRQALIVNDCGTGSGGFKPGNTCAKGGGSFPSAEEHPYAVHSHSDEEGPNAIISTHATLKEAKSAAKQHNASSMQPAIVRSRGGSKSLIAKGLPLFSAKTYGEHSPSGTHTWDNKKHKMVFTPTDGTGKPRKTTR